MKKFTIVTKNAVLILSMLIFVGIIGSCDKHKMTQFTWDKSVGPTLVEISPDAALEGEEVTITGRYFSATAENQVSFNGLDATIVKANISEIVAIVPVGATSGDLMVSSDGIASINSLPFSVVQPIIPTITSIDPERGKVGQEITITGVDFSTTPSENIVKFNGVDANVVASTATTINVIVPAGATTGNVTVTRDGESNGVLFTVTVSYTVVATIANEEDDAEEGAINGAMALSSSDLELGEYDTWTQAGIDQGVQTIGVRFNAIDIPAGATILSASVQFTCDATGADEAEMKIYGEDVANAVVYSNAPYNISTRAKTLQSVVWNIPEWVGEGDAGPAQRTPELISIVQAIVDRADWVSGNSMAFILEPYGTTVDETSSSGGREAEAGPGSDAATITIVYEL